MIVNKVKEGKVISLKIKDESYVMSNVKFHGKNKTIFETLNMKY